MDGAVDERCAQSCPLSSNRSPSSPIRMVAASQLIQPQMEGGSALANPNFAAAHGTGTVHAND